MKKVLFLIVVAIIATSCVSKDDYDSAKYQARYWEDAYNSLNDEYGALNRKHQDLINQYNQLVDEYNQLNYNNSYYLNDSQNNEAIIERAKEAVDKLQDHFRSFRNGYWYDADDIERDIRSVEDKLNGWL
jgi:sugar-specific transcriptional regulator TrmB